MSQIFTTESVKTAQDLSFLRQIPSNSRVDGDILADFRGFKTLFQHPVKGGVGLLQNFVGTTSSSMQVTGFLNGTFAASGTITTDYSTGVTSIGILDPVFRSTDAGAAVAIRNRSANPKLQRLGLMSIKRKPKVWVYTGWDHVVNEGWVFEGSWTMAYLANVHKFKVEDPVCSDIVEVNPGAESFVYDVKTAVSELNWSYVSKIELDNFYFEGLEKKVTDFSSEKWENSWPSTAPHYAAGKSPNAKFKGPIIPHFTKLDFRGGFADGGPWHSFGRIGSNGVARTSSYIFANRGGVTPEGVSYNGQYPLAVSILVKMKTPNGPQEVIETIPVSEVTYVSNIDVFNNINTGNSCMKRKTMNMMSPVLIRNHVN